MSRLNDTIARLARMPRGMGRAAISSRLTPFEDFGGNPGNLDAWLYVPASAGPEAPLVVVLHGCTQSAAGYDESAGWSRLAEEHGFVLLYPEQRRANNSNLCFNWFSADDAARGKGEALSIRQMVAAVHKLHRTDPERAFVTGLSAGGAMAAAMLATYPDVFAGGAVIAGLPFGVAKSVPQALDRMRGHGGPDSAALSELVRAASAHSGKWPILSVWHGSEDQVVEQSNARALVEQWRKLHGAASIAARSDLVHGYPHRIWCDPSGREVIEEYSITGLAHGTPLDTLGSSGQEKAAPHMLEAGISSTRLISRFWGIVPEERDMAVRNAPARQRAAHADDAEKRVGQVARPAQDGISRTIEDALRSAGLMR